MSRQNRRGLQALVVAAPVTGVVTTPKLEEKVGQLVRKGELIAEIFDLDQIKAEIAMPEKELADVRTGQEVQLKIRAYPEKTFYGAVTGIAPIVNQPEPQTMPGRTVRVTVQLDNRSGLMKPGMTGHAKIFCGERRVYDVLFRRFVRFFRVEFWSWW